MSETLTPIHDAIEAATGVTYHHAIAPTFIAALAERGYAVVRDDDFNDHFLQHIVETYCYTRDECGVWTDVERRAICTILQAMGMAVTDTEGWNAAIEKRRAMIRAAQEE